MTHPRGAPRAWRALAALAVVAVVGGACAFPAPTSPGTATPPAASPGGPSIAPGRPGASPSGEATPPPSGTPAGSPGPTPSGEPGSPSPAASPGGAAACTGSDDNRSFYAALAAVVAWDVYCPVLPAGWFVDTGEFRQASGGKLEISYKGPAGARLELREGAFCAGQEGCLPTGADAGAASFGDRPGRLLDLGDGTWVVLADEGDAAWEVTSRAMDGPTLAAFAAAFAKVGR